MSRHITKAMMLDMLEDQALGGMLQSQGQGFLRSFGLVMKKGDLSRILKDLVKRETARWRLKSGTRHGISPRKYLTGAYKMACSWCYQGKHKPCLGVGNPKGNSKFWNVILKRPHEQRVRRAYDERRFGK